jgi:hypothetical protein
MSGSRRGSGAAESVCAVLFSVKAVSAAARVLGVRPDGVNMPDERNEPSEGGMRDGRGLMVILYYEVLVAGIEEADCIQDLRVLTS